MFDKMLFVKLGVGSLAAAALAASTVPVFAADSKSTPSNPKAAAAAIHRCDGERRAATDPAPASKKHDGRRDERACDARAIREALRAAEAGTLGMSPDELREDLRHESLGELAARKGFDEKSFGQAVAKDLQPRLEKMVDSHEISADRAHKLLDRLNAGHVPGWHRHDRKAAVKKS